MEPGRPPAHHQWARRFSLGFTLMMPFLAQHMGSGLGLQPAGPVASSWGCGSSSQQGSSCWAAPWGSESATIPPSSGAAWYDLRASCCWAGPSPCPSCCWPPPSPGFAGALFTPAPRPALPAECHSPSQRQRLALHNLGQPGRACCSAPGRPHPDPAELCLTGILAASLFALLRCCVPGAAQTPGGNPEARGAILRQWGA